MKVIAFSGSARKQGNTALVLQKVLEGAQLQGAEVELINLFDYEYTSCRACLGCKHIKNAGKGICVIQDDFQKLAEKAKQADAIVFGTPIFCWDTSGQFRSFFERLMYSMAEYVLPRTSLWPKQVPSAFVYTLGATYFDELDASLRLNVINHMERLFKYPPEVFCVEGSFMFKNLENYYAPRFENAEGLHYGPTAEQEQQAIALGEKLVAAYKALNQEKQCKIIRGLYYVEQYKK